MTNVSSLGLPYVWTKAIEEATHEHRMNWELWIESGESFNDIVKSVRKRGYTNVNPISEPMFHLNHIRNDDQIGVKDQILGSRPPEANKLAMKKLNMKKN